MNGSIESDLAQVCWKCHGVQVPSFPQSGPLATLDRACYFVALSALARIDAHLFIDWVAEVIKTVPAYVADVPYHGFSANVHEFSSSVKVMWWNPIGLWSLILPIG